MNRINKHNDRLEIPKNHKCVCGGPLLCFRSMYYKVCDDCGQEYNWLLKQDQLPLINQQR